MHKPPIFLVAVLILCDGRTYSANHRLSRGQFRLSWRCVEGISFGQCTSCHLKNSLITLQPEVGSAVSQEHIPTAISTKCLGMPMSRTIFDQSALRERCSITMACTVRAVECLSVHNFLPGSRQSICRGYWRMEGISSSSHKMRTTTFFYGNEHG